MPDQSDTLLTAAQRLRALRMHRKLSAKALGERADVNEVSLYRIEGGHAVPRRSTLSRLAQALHCSSAWLAEGLGPSPLEATEKLTSSRPTAAAAEALWPIAVLLGQQRPSLGRVSEDEIRFLQHRASEYDDPSPDDMELDLLIRRARLDRNDPEKNQAVIAALERQRIGAGAEPAPFHDLERWSAQRQQDPREPKILKRGPKAER